MLMFVNLLLTRANVECSALNFTVVNIVASLPLGILINMPLLDRDLPLMKQIQQADPRTGQGGLMPWEPQKFRGRPFSIQDPSHNTRIALVAFSSGNWVLAGMTSSEQLDVVLKWLDLIDIEKYRVGSAYERSAGVRTSDLPVRRATVEPSPLPPASWQAFLLPELQPLRQVSQPSQQQQQQQQAPANTILSFLQTINSRAWQAS
jgi:hypothetical protein